MKNCQHDSGATCENCHICYLCAKDNETFTARWQKIAAVLHEMYKHQIPFDKAVGLIAVYLEDFLKSEEENRE